MTHGEAIRLVAMLAAYFNRDVSDETAVLWSEALGNFETQDAMEAAHTLGTMSRFMPSLADFIDATIESRNDRLAREGTGLPEVSVWPEHFCSIDTFLRDNPDMRERVKRLGVWGKTIERIEGSP